MAYTNRPFNFTGTLFNQIQNDLELANDNFDILAQVFVNNDPVTGIVKNADMLDGFHVSQTPAPNVIVPLNANGRIYNYVARGKTVFDPTDFTMSNNTEYCIGSVSITTPSWSPSGAWKLIFVVISQVYFDSVGINNFKQRVKFDTNVIDGAWWLWNTSNTILGIGFEDTFVMPDLGNGVTQSYNFYILQGSGTANAVFKFMIVQWYLIPA